HAKQRRADHVRHLREHFITAAGYFLITGVLSQRPQAIEAGRDQRLVFLGRDFVARELLGQKAVEGLIVLKSANDVIAIAPRVLAMRIVFEAIGLGETYHVQPVLPPALTVVRAIQKLVD